MQTLRTQMEYRDAQCAFNDAIKAGVLSTRTAADNYAGDYMYMGTVNGRDQFKNINTRMYLGKSLPDGLRA